MADTTFINGTIVQPAWLNDVNAQTYSNTINALSPGYGIVADGATSASAALQSLVNLASALVTNRFLRGVTIFLPHGNYLIDTPVVITTSNIHIVGESIGGTVLYNPSSTATSLISFDGSALALYNVGMQNVRFYTPGNATIGCHLKVRRAINAIFQNIAMDGWYDGLISDGCAKTIFNNILCTQENRTAGTTCRYAMDFQSTGPNNSDVHVSNYQVVVDPATMTFSNTISIRGSDGIYFSNGHQHGATLLQPTSVTCSTVMWNNIYFDQSTSNNVKFTGTSAAYRNFWFTNCYFRFSGGSGLAIDASSTVSKIMISNCEFNTHRLFGIYGFSDFTDMIISNCVFDGNNTDNAALTGDILIGGTATINGCRFKGGGAAGTAILLNGNASNSLVINNHLVASTAGTKIANTISSNQIRGNPGFVTKNYGQSSIINPATSIVVSHGLGVTPSVADIQLTAINATAAATAAYVGTVTSTQFTITGTPSAGTATWAWTIDTEHQ
jgi:hypothetical protein